MRYIITLLLCVQVLLLGACGDEKGDLTPPNLALDPSALPYLQEPTSDPVITLSGTTDPDASIEVVVNTDAKVTIQTNSGGLWMFDLTPAQGSNLVTISASDQRGNYNQMKLLIVHDAEPPVVSIDQYLTPTVATSQIVGGTVETGSTVAVTVDDPAVTVGTVEVNNTFWSCPISGLTVDKVYTVSVIATDATGNTSDPTAPIDPTDPTNPATREIYVNSSAKLLTVDPVAPTDPTDSSTASTTTLTGNKESGYMVTVTPPANVTAAAVIGSITDTSWSCVLTGLKKGNNLVKVKLLDGSTEMVTAGVVVVRDDVPPVITAVRPFAGYTTSAAAVTEVTATFNEQLDSSTINAATFLLKDALNITVPGTVSYDSATRIASFVPTTLPLADGLYTATVNTEVTDLLGNHLALNKIWTFTIQAP